MSRKKNTTRHTPSLPTPGQVKLDEVASIVERAKAALSPEDHATLKAAIDQLAFMTAELQSKQTSLERLRRMIFGATTEKTATVLGETASADPNTPAGAHIESGDSNTRPPVPGHGRNRAAAYTGADQVKISHPRLHGGDHCPGCESGKVYPLAEPSTRVRITGVAPLSATVYECDRLRCNLCGEVYTAPAPEGVGEEKYDATASTLVGLLKYGTGLPFNRIEKLQEGMGIPLPAATQWDLVHAQAHAMTPAHEELINRAAQGRVVYNDDTTMKVLQLTRQQRAASLASTAAQERTGLFTSGIVATGDDHKIALFFTGTRHAGENLAKVLKRRAAELPPPIQMCDGLSANTSGDFETVVSNCVAHARRKYVDVAESFPEEVRFVLETLREVYRTDARARDLTPEKRLHLHKTESAPRMLALESWMREQIEQRKVEPNSGLGDAIRYMQKRWARLTLFLTIEGAPLDNNVCERALKKAILHRKNALFYQTLNGARVGDVFMSLIHTAELNGVAPFDYLVALQRHAEEVCDSPGDWMPWNFQSTLARRHTAGPAAPA